MRRKIAGLAASIIALACIAAAPASAAGASQGRNGCFSETYAVAFGVGIAVNCGYGEGDGYRVVAHCASGGDFWYALGTYVPYGFGPSVAKCEGGLFSPAGLGGYHIIED
ncbi:hypothetical protein OG943_06070 [Amycolatopsis sp. NBC_00345]|uniref:hypothetical protein n=1 Tax=Amycolatopsis sp. NBC_00345 TaxID=2975955 RepID=UPI002E25796E